MEIGLVGAPNSGKSTFFNAATMLSVETGNRPFVTIKPHEGIAYVKVKSVHTELGVEAKPKHGYVKGEWRFVPIKLWDVAGLVPDACKGKGLGNQFLNDIMQASALIHVLDASGSTNCEGEVVGEGNFDPLETGKFLTGEISQWIKGILSKNWSALSKRVETEKITSVLAKPLSGLGISEEDVRDVLRHGEFPEKITGWGDDSLLEFAELVREKSKPITIAANKIDLKSGKENLEKLEGEFSDNNVVPVSAEAELALRKAAEHGLIEYVPGDSDFKELKELPEKQKHALEFIRENVLKEFGGTGVQKIINSVAFELLDLIVVYPVEDQNKWSDSKGNVLPDAYLLKKGSTPMDLAAKIHTSFAEKFVAAIDCRTGQKLSHNAELQNNAVVKIQKRS